MLGLDNPVHLIFLLVLLLLVFGAKRLPEIGRSLGSGMRGFKESLSGETSGPDAVEPRLAAPAPATVAATTSEPTQSAARR
jgi:sec-independent protein translocase protein TatA